MSYKYHNPATVLSPKNSIEKVEVIFDGGIGKNAFSIAKVIWNGKIRIAIRWNITEKEWNEPLKINGSVKCVGEPNSRGYPTWFILPDCLLTSLLQENDNKSENGKIIREGVQKAIEELKRVRPIESGSPNKELNGIISTRNENKNL